MSVPHLISSYEWDHGLSGRAIAVYRWLAWRENVNDLRCDPSHHDIARGTGFGVTTVRKALEELRTAGWVTWRGRARKGRGRTSNTYELTPRIGHDLNATVDNWSTDLTPTRGGGSSTVDVGIVGSRGTPPQQSADPPSTVGEEQEVELDVEPEVEKEKNVPRQKEADEEEVDDLALRAELTEQAEGSGVGARLARAQLARLEKEDSG
jgi:predicted transcriptional regulator